MNQTSVQHIGEKEEFALSAGAAALTQHTEGRADSISMILFSKRLV